MNEIDVYKIQQIVDNGYAVQISLIEDVQTEPLSQKQLITENVAKKLDDDTKKQVMPLLEAILQAQPTIRVKVMLKQIFPSQCQKIDMKRWENPKLAIN